MNSIILVDELAETFGNKICCEQILFDFVSLQDDPSFKIRKELVSRLIRFSQTLGDEIFLGVIIPVYRKLSQDQIWSVRKACVEILPEVSKIASEEVKSSQILQLFDKFSKDSSKWVKMATFQFFGPFIFSFEHMDPNSDLLEYFLSMGKPGEKIQSIS